MKPIIKSLIDTDLYKLTMLQAYYHQYPNAVGKWHFHCRNKDVKLGFLAWKVKAQIKRLKDLRLTDEEAEYLLSLGFFKKDFVHWLQNGFQVDLAELNVWSDKDCQLQITVSGMLTHVNILEVYTLAIVNELYFQHDLEESGYTLADVEKEGRFRLESKVEKLEDYPQLKFAEFGTRRRYSAEWQDFVVGYLVKNCPKNIVGTSNVGLAMKHGIKPIGTVAHEWTCSHLGLVDDIAVAQKRALCVWQQEYGESLGIALSDTFRSESFFRDFDRNLCRSYDGLRHDSGCPFKFGEMAIAHYMKSGVDPRTKSLIFSDGLTIERCIDIWRNFAGRIGLSFGVGTHLSNDLGRTPLNIVMKLLECNGTQCIKLSDESGKEIGCPNMIEIVKKAYGVS